MPYSDKPSWTTRGESADSRFGFRACFAGDVNGDGYSDLIVGAPGFNHAHGKAYLYLGGPQGLSAKPAWELCGDNEGDSFGDRVGSAGDLNGDGYGDLFIAAPNWKHGFGKLCVIYGGKDVSHLRVAWSAAGARSGDLFGDCTVPTGDLNGDGFDDLAIGAYGFDDTRGKVQVYYGSKSGLAKAPAWKAEGEAKGDQFGYGICGAVDLNGDGFDDLVVASKYNSQAFPQAGKVYAYYGSAKGLSNSAWTQLGPNKGANLGTRVYGAGDLNGDQVSDLLLAAPYSDNGKGEVQLVAGGKIQSTFETLTPNDGETGFGFCLGPLGQLGKNFGQGFFISSLHQETGRVSIYTMETFAGHLRSRWLQTLESPKANDQFGKWCAPAGDLNGDGLPDLCVGAMGDGPGRVDIYYGIAGPADAKSSDAHFGYFLGSSTKIKKFSAR